MFVQASLVVPGATTATSSRTHIAMMNGHYYNFLPSWTVDGNINQSILACLHTATSGVTEAWLRIDLGSVKSVFSIQMWYRNDRKHINQPFTFFLFLFFQICSMNIGNNQLYDYLRSWCQYEYRTTTRLCYSSCKWYRFTNEHGRRVFYWLKNSL